MQFGLNAHTDRADIDDALNDLHRSTSDYRDTAEGIKLTREQVFHKSKGDRNQAPNVVVFIATGSSSISSDSVQSEVKKLQDTGALFLSIGLGPDVDPDETKDVAPDYWSLKDYVAMRRNAFHDAVLSRICSWQNQWLRGWDT